MIRLSAKYSRLISYFLAISWRSCGKHRVFDGFRAKIPERFYSTSFKAEFDATELTTLFSWDEATFLKKTRFGPTRRGNEVSFF